MPANNTEIEGVRQASGALNELAKLMPDIAEHIWGGSSSEEVPTSKFRLGDLVLVRQVNLPFQVTERVNETRATRIQREEKRAGHVVTLFDYW